MAGLHRIRFYRIIAFFAALFILTGAANGVELILPENLFFHRPVASVWGQTAVWTNPAALSYGHSGIAVIFTHRDERLIRDWGTASTLKVSGMAYRHIDGGDEPDLNEYVFALGGGRRFGYGLSYRYIKDGPGYLNRRHLWTLGFLSRNKKNFAYGIRIENLNRGRINGKRSDIRYTFGTAARVYRDMVTATLDVDMTGKESLHQADFRTGIEIRPLPGMYLYVDFDNHWQFNLGFRLNFGSNYAGHYHNFNRDGKTVLSTSYIGSVKGKQPSLTKPLRKTLLITLNGDLPENPKIPLFRKRPLRFLDFIDGIYRAADDDSVDKIFLQIGSLRCGMAKVEELSGAIRRFRARDKKVIAYLERPNNLGYLLASTADSVFIPPVSELPLVGLRAELQTYKGLLDKIGVEVEVERVEEYKNAPEPFIFDRPSEPCRQQINRILDGLYAELVTSIAANREMTSDSVEVLIDKAPLMSIEAKEYGLVDDTCYLDKALEDYSGSGRLVNRRRVSLHEYLHQPIYDDRWGEPPKLALIIADGEITEGKSGGKVGEYEMLSAIRKARLDKNIKGMVLRINSPGGSASASDLIWHEIEKTARAKPLVISMGNVAASGGYYISSVKNEILVNKSTITGSIGVFAGKANLSRLFDKIGIYSESHLRGRNAGMYSLSEPFTPEQREKLKTHISEFYRHFIGKVAKARSITPDSANALGRGQVWTGAEAVENGLADRIGGLHQSIEILQETCGLRPEDTEMVTLPEKHYFFESPFDLPGLCGKVSKKLFGSEESFVSLETPETGLIFFRMPYYMTIE
jgi:protease-4